MAKFTCITCQIAYTELEWQREHFQSDWHRYNLKRKVAELPPVSHSLFEERILSQKSKLEEDKPESKYCLACKKIFSNKKSYENHINSKKHIENAKKVTPSKGKETVTGKDVSRAEKRESKKQVIDIDSDGEEIEEVDSDEWEGEPISETDCLFCCHTSKSMEKNMTHMTSIHSFFIPDLEYCINLHGLINYLGQKIGCGFQCLWCNEKSRNFWTLEAAQSHMRDKGHCMMKFEGETLLEYSSFYDYSSSYPDAGEGVSPDEEVTSETLFIDGYELILPSGATVGHRSLLRYYKQRFKPNRSLVIHHKSSKSIHSIVMSHYKALGWGGASKADVVKRARDVQYMRQMQSKKWVHLGIKANKFQTHYRPQVMF